jgi:ketosteroid isomerase-like protein
MEAEKIRVVEQMVDAWNRRDLDLGKSLVGDDFAYVNPPNAVEPGIRRGLEGYEHVVRAQWEALGREARLEVAKFHTLEHRVVTEGTVSRSMPGSTARVENKIAMGWTFDGDRLIQLEILGAGSSYHEGLAAAGIGEG